jgi:hypothetical protein
MADSGDLSLADLDVHVRIADLLDELFELLGRYVVFPSSEAQVAVTLWVAATHAQSAWEHAPRLVVKSPEKRCGKSRLLDIIEATCHDPLVTVNISSAALVRCIDFDDPPTILVDEADTLFGSKRVSDANEDLRGILNAGHARNRPYLRFDMRRRRTEKCPTFAMAMLAGIGDQPATIEDRGIVISMRRRLTNEEVAPFRTRRDACVLHALRDRLAVAVRGQLDELADAAPEMPVEDRLADTWEPLIAIADCAGGRWCAEARRACLAMADIAEAGSTERSTGERLLQDVREVFRVDGGEFIASTHLVDQLKKLEDAPWSDYEITSHALAGKLRKFGIRPRHNATRDARGYHLTDCLDAFGRYLPAEGAGGGLSTGTDGGDECGRLPF